MTLAEPAISQRQVLVTALGSCLALGRASCGQVPRGGGAATLHRAGKRSLGAHPVALRQGQQSPVEIAPFTGGPKSAKRATGGAQQTNQKGNEKPDTDHGAANTMND